MAKQQDFLPSLHARRTHQTSGTSSLCGSPSVEIDLASREDRRRHRRSRPSAVAWAAQLAQSFDGDSSSQRAPTRTELKICCAGRPSILKCALDLRVDHDVPGGIVRAAEEENADVLVVGNVGMGGRREFLLGNVPNRISHTARCTVVIVNTSDGVVPEPPTAPAVEGRLLGRAAQIARIISRLGLDVRGTITSAENAQRVRAALEELGPTFAKLGQIARPGPICCLRSSSPSWKLQDNVKPLTEAEVVRVMEQELRVPWEDVFASSIRTSRRRNDRASASAQRSITGRASSSRCSGRERGRNSA
jgi:hypothetical protein